jgi:hypothetical protein
LPSQGGMLSVALSHAWFESAPADMPVIYGKGGLREGKKFTASLGVNGLFDLLAEKGYNGRVKSGFIASDLAYWRMR